MRKKGKIYYNIEYRGVEKKKMRIRMYTRVDIYMDIRGYKICPYTSMYNT